MKVLFLGVLIALFFMFVSSSLLGMMLLFLGSVVFFRLRLDHWSMYFTILIYFGGLFILLVYISVISYSRELPRFLGIVFLPLLPFDLGVRLSSNDSFFFMLSQREALIGFLLGLLFLGLILLFITLSLPSGKCSRGRL